MRWLVSFSYFIFIDQNFSNIKLSNVIRGNQLTFTSQYYWKSTWSPLRAWCRLGTAGMRGVAQLYSKFWIHSFQNFEFTLFIIRITFSSRFWIHSLQNLVGKLTWVQKVPKRGGVNHSGLVQKFAEVNLMNPSYSINSQEILQFYMASPSVSSSPPTSSPPSREYTAVWGTMSGPTSCGTGTGTTRWLSWSMVSSTSTFILQPRRQVSLTSYVTSLLV